MACGDLQQSDAWTLGMAATLLPVAQRVNADLEGARELPLAELREPALGAEPRAYGRKKTPLRSSVRESGRSLVSNDVTRNW